MTRIIAGTAQPRPSTTRTTGHVLLIGILLAWGAAVAALSAIGWYRALYPPVIGAIVAAGVAIPAVGYFAIPAMRRYFEQLGLFWITAFHVWRIPAAILFFWYGAQGLLPDQFVRNAGWGDLIAGALAVAVILAPKTRGRYWGLHLFGFVDFVVAVGTGLAFTLLHDPRMSPIADLPLALIPLWGVGISGASHIIAFDLLARRRGMQPHP